MSRHESIFFCFCGPTASGKSTLCRKVLTELPGLKLSTSTTTRPARDGESDGEHYYFVSDEEFDARIQSGKFLEWANFAGYRYGTERRNFDQALAQDTDLLLDIEIQGVAQLKKLFPKNVVTIFVFPVSFATLEKRLRARQSETEVAIQARLLRAREEIRVLSQENFSDYFLNNDSLEQSVQQVLSIIQAERLSFVRQRECTISKLLES